MDYNCEMVKWARNNAKYSKKKAASLLDCNSEQLQDWENGDENIPFETLHRMAKVYQIPIVVFYYENPPKIERNGCGGKGSWFRPPLGVFFEASCNQHDVGYSYGGDKSRRMECDAKFLAMMLSDTMRIISVFKRTYYQIWAFLYFFAVRLGGKKYFNYRDIAIKS